MRIAALACLASLTFVACNGPEPTAAGTQPAGEERPFQSEVLGRFEEPWAMTFLPDGLLLITEKGGSLRFLDLAPATPRLGSVSGVPQVDYGGQGGLGDVVPHPDFEDNRLIYLSYAEAGEGDVRGAAVARGQLVCEQADACRLENVEVVWRQVPKVSGRGHYGHRLAFGPDGKLWISSGERQKFDPAQDMNANLGKIVRLHDDGSVPADNPFASRGGVAAQIWSLGHRNPLGIAFDGAGRLWEHEMGPRGGDEFNLIVPGDNYGYPIVSNGDHYNGRPIPDHDTRPEFNPPEITWTPVVSPAGLIFYDGDLFPQWKGSFLLGGLSGQALVRVLTQGEDARVADRWDMGARIREVEQGPDGAVYILEDDRGSSQGRLLRLTPAR
ncbi:MAG: PQQ-dependent sugar dehydrogenase [Sphingomonadaceae bacterium]